MFVPGTLDYLVQLQSNDPTATPTIWAMIVYNIHPGYMPAGWRATFSCISDTETEIRNSTNDGGTPETIYDIKTNIIL